MDTSIQLRNVPTQIDSLGFGTLTSAAWRSDGSMFAVGGKLGVHLYDSKFTQLYFLDEKNVSTVAWNSNGQLLAVENPNGINIWQVTNSEHVYSFKRFKRPVWHPKQSLLAFYSENTGSSIIQIVDITTEQVVSEFPATPTSHVAWSMDGSKIAVTNDVGASRIYQWPSATLLFTLSSQGGPVLIGFSQDGKRLVTGLEKERLDGSTSNAVRVWDGDTGAFQTTLQTGLVSAFSWNVDGITLAVGARAANGMYHVFIWDMITSSLLYELGSHINLIHSLVWGVDGETLMSAGTDNQLYLWHIANNGTSLLATLNGFSGSITSLDWSPDGQRLASGSRDGNTRIWNVATHTISTVLQAPNAVAIWAVSWNPHAEVIASGDAGNAVNRWYLAQNESGTVVNLHTSSINQGNRIGVQAVAWSPDGRNLASGGTDGVVRVRLGDVEQRLLQGSDYWPVTSLAWSPDSSQLASPNGPLFIWNVQSSQVQRTLSCRGGRVLDVAWNSRNEIAGSAADGICIWDAARGSLLEVIDAVNAHNLRWEPRNRYLAFIALSPVTAKDVPYILDLSTFEVTRIDKDDVQTLSWNTKGGVLAFGDESGQVTFWTIPD